MRTLSDLLLYLLQQPRCCGIVLLYQRRQLDTDQSPILDYRPPVDVVVIHMRRGGEHHRGHRVVECSGVLDPVQRDGDEVRSLAGFE